MIASRYARDFEGARRPTRLLTIANCYETRFSRHRAKAHLFFFFFSSPFRDRLRTTPRDRFTPRGRVIVISANKSLSKMLIDRASPLLRETEGDEVNLSRALTAESDENYSVLMTASC